MQTECQSTAIAWCRESVFGTYRFAVGRVDRTGKNFPCGVGFANFRAAGDAGEHLVDGGEVRILHVTQRSAWQRALEDGCYQGDSLATEGFIHCCAPHQLDHVLTSYFQGQGGLVLLEIDEALVTEEIRYEGGFPHVYGVLPVAAVVAVRDLPSDN